MEKWIACKISIIINTSSIFKTISSLSSENNCKGKLPYFQCFQNLESILQTLLDSEIFHPHLSEVIDIDDKCLNKHDALDIKLTKRNKPDNNASKLKIFAIFNVHVRKYH